MRLEVRRKKFNLPLLVSKAQAKSESKDLGFRELVSPCGALNENKGQSQTTQSIFPGLYSMDVRHQSSTFDLWFIQHSVTPAYRDRTTIRSVVARKLLAIVVI